MHGHQVFRGSSFRSNIPDSRPLGIPSVSTVIGVTGLGKTVITPAFFRLPYGKDYGLVVPSERPDRIGRRRGIAVDAAGAGNLGELVASHELPVLPVPLDKGSGRDVELLLGKFSFLSVIGIDRYTLSRIESLTVIAGEQGTEVAGETFLALLVAVLVELDTIKGMDIDVVETGFHRSVEYAILRIGQGSRQTCRTARELIVRKDPDILVGIDGVRTDEELA